MNEEMMKDTVATAKTLIDALKGTAAGLKIALDQERDRNEGLALTCAKLQDEVDSLTEEVFRLQAELSEQKETAGEAPVPDFAGPLADKLSFYYNDFCTLNPKELGEEEAARLYQVMDYTYKSLKKAGIPLKKEKAKE